MSECIWDGVTENDEDLSYMFDETTPIKNCGDLAYNVSNGNWASFLVGHVFSF